MSQNSPTGTVTFLFTDIEGSTRLAQEHPASFESLRQRHHDILYKAIGDFNGYVFQIIGDAFCAAFHTAGEALQAAIRGQRDLAREPWGQAPIRVRMGIHTGRAEIQTGGIYQGYLTLCRVQRIMSVAHGGQILISNPSVELMRGDLPEGVTLQDMLEHRLKSLLNPEHLWQPLAPGLEKDFPAIASLNNIPNNLPIQLTSFIGREKEIADLVGRVGEHLLVTLTGSGGTGKTRLSLEVAAELVASFPDGVWFLELAPISDPALVINGLANLLGLRESGESKRPLAELVCAYLSQRKVLLILDNCEHLIDSVARLADLILRSCKQVRILATSREALGVAGELAWHLPSLSLPDLKHLPDPEQLSQYESVRLFIDRVSLTQPHFVVTKENAPAIAQVCARLDGIPLALELAAARVNVLSVEQIAKRLDDRFRLLTGGSRTALPRQQTLRATIDWSYNLLSTEESLLFRRLSVFVGGWTLEAAESICTGDDLDHLQVLDLLSQLVNKSLVLVIEAGSEIRYRTLETVRQYGREKLFETEEAATLRDRHLDYYILLAEEGDKQLLGKDILIWIGRLEAENDNFRAALNWALESPQVDPLKGLQLAGALTEIWDILGFTAEGFNWLSQTLQKAPDAPNYARARGLFGAGLLSIRLSYWKDAISFLNQSLVIARQVNETTLLVRCLLWVSNVDDSSVELNNDLMQEAIRISRAAEGQPFLPLMLGFWAIWYASEISETQVYLKEAFDLATKRRNARELATIHWQYGSMEMRLANLEHARQLLQESYRMACLLKDRHLTALSLLMLGRTATRQGEYEQAIRYEEEGLQILRDISDRSCSHECTYHLGWNAFLAGDLPQAETYFQDDLTILNEYELTMHPFMPEFGLGRVALSLGDLAAARQHFKASLEGHKKSLGNADYFLAYCLEAVCALPDVDPVTAARILGRVQAIRQKHGYLLSAPELRLLEPVVEGLRVSLGEAAYQAEFEAGAQLTTAKMLDNALELVG